MASALYLESYLESIENLPQELRRNFALMRELDQRTEDLKVDIERNSDSYCRTVNRLNKDDMVVELNSIEDMFKKAVENSDNKVQLAMQMYEMVDKYIRRLDGELSRFEQELQLKNPSGSRTSISSVSDIQPMTIAGHGRKRSSGAAEGGQGGGNPGPARRRKTLNSVTEDTGPFSPSTVVAVGNQTASTDVLDMPVDPNEPTYCLCHQVSFGEMVGCDNSDCPIEWFHFQCVGLSQKPTGKWYCPKCSQEKEKKKKY